MFMTDFIKTSKIYWASASLLCLAVVVGGFLLLKQGSAAAEDLPWKKRCEAVSQPDGTQIGYCEMFNRLVVQATGAVFMDFAIGYPPGQDVAKGRMLLPLGILLSEGVRMQIDDQGATVLPVRYCDKQGCHVFLNLADDVISMLKKGNNVTLSYVLSSNKRLTFPVSLTGFSKIIKTLSK